MLTGNFSSWMKKKKQFDFRTGGASRFSCNPYDLPSPGPSSKGSTSSTGIVVAPSSSRHQSYQPFDASSYRGPRHQSYQLFDESFSSATDEQGRYIDNHFSSPSSSAPARRRPEDAATAPVPSSNHRIMARSNASSNSPTGSTTLDGDRGQMPLLRMKEKNHHSENRGDRTHSDTNAHHGTPPTAANQQQASTGSGSAKSLTRCQKRRNKKKKAARAAKRQKQQPSDNKSKPVNEKTVKRRLQRKKAKKKKLFESLQVRYGRRVNRMQLPKESSSSLCSQILFFSLRTICCSLLCFFPSTHRHCSQTKKNQTKARI